MNFPNEEHNWCVYAHINKQNKKVYVGISSNIKNRWHVTSYDPKQAIRAAFNKYGWDGFDHIILIDGLTKTQARECEKYLIKKYNLQDRKVGYNRSPGGEIISDNRGAKSAKSKITYQYDLDGNYLRSWDCAADAERALGISQISACCLGRKQICGNWQWRYDYQDKLPPYIPVDMSEFNKKEYPRINKYDIYGNYIETIDDVHIYSQREKQGIIDCCRGIRVQALGYIWLYEKDATKQNIKNAIIRYQNTYYSVLQFDLNGKFLNKYETVQEAADYYCCSKEAINHACSGTTRKAIGYMWRYEKDCNGYDDIAPYNNPNCKEILQFDLNGQYIKTWESTYATKKVYGGNVTNALHSRKDHVAYGYMWFFKNTITDYVEMFNLQLPDLFFKEVFL